MQSASRYYQILFLMLCFATLFFHVVLPNSLRSVSVPLLLLCFALSTPFVHFASLRTLLKLHFVSSIVTLIYIFVGQQKGAPTEAAIQVIVIYILSPILWLFISSAIISLLSEKMLMAWFQFYTVAAVASSALFYYLFLTVGPDAVRLFMQEPNVTMHDGEAKATMHVYGSLIFLAGGMFAAPNAIPNPLLRSLLLLAIAIASLCSGRSALIIAPIIGFVVGFVHRRIMHESIRLTVAMGGLGSVLVLLVVLPLLLKQLEINPFAILENVSVELRERGGSERSEQFVELCRGIVDSNGIGVGHGIGVDYLRSDDHPWRYELVWVATVLRVGMFGAAIYCLPFLYYINLSFQDVMRRRLSTDDLFFFVGFLTAFIASNTNPYIEGYTFHWMYVLPLVRATYLRHS